MKQTGSHRKDCLRLWTKYHKVALINVERAFLHSMC